MSVALNFEYEDQLDKLRTLCENNGLEFEISKDKFPIAMTIRPNWEDAAQAKIEFVEQPDATPRTDPEAWIKLIFGGDLVINTSLDFAIDDDLFSKIKNGCKKLHYAYLQLFFAVAKQTASA